MLHTWVSITALASLGAVKPTLGSKIPETLLPDMEKNLRDFSFPRMKRNNFEDSISKHDNVIFGFRVEQRLIRQHNKVKEECTFLADCFML